MEKEGKRGSCRFPSRWNTYKGFRPTKTHGRSILSLYKPVASIEIMRVFLKVTARRRRGVVAIGSGPTRVT